MPAEPSLDIEAILRTLAGHQLLMTRFGPLDVLGLIGEGREYSDLAPHTIEMDVDERLTVFRCSHPKRSQATVRERPS